MSNTTPTVEPILVDKARACAMLGGICTRTLDRHVKEGRLPVVRINPRAKSRVLFDVADLRALADRCKIGGAA